jgi:uncharacterized protein (DUF1684 family)
MKNALITIIITFLFYNCTSNKSSYNEEIKLFQYELNLEFADASKSPLTPEDLKTFKNLDFFEIDEDYKIEADFERTPYSPIFEMQTTTERLPLYKKYGIANFTLNGEKIALSVYQNQQLMTSLEYENYLFLPFNDPTNGNSSYGGGRFIDLEIPNEGSTTISIDFNKAYNPYCAYNHNFSCPIPPSENNIKIPIPVGVKAFKNHE